MECNKDEAIRAKEMAEKKMQSNDFEGARKIASKARNIYPELENITQLLTTCDVHCSAAKGLLGHDKDWYGILQVEKFADESMIKKQYRRLALTLHPDKNRFPGAEGAFKLICEASALLSDPAKKSIYDAKVKASIRSSLPNPPTHYMNRSTNVNNQYGAQNNTPNGFSNPNQHQSTQSTSSISLEVFWTCCPFCHVRYQYLRQFINRSLQCKECSKAFVGYEVSSRGVPLGSKSAQPGAQHVRPKSVPSQAAGSQEKVAPNQGNCKVGVQSDKGPSAQHAEGSEGIGAEGIAVANAAKETANLNKKETNIHDGNSMNGEKEGKTTSGDAISRETEQVRKKGRKRDKKVVSESSESYDTSNHSDEEDLFMKGNFDGCSTDLNFESSHSRFVRRSSRKRQNVSYNESDEGNPASSLKTAQTAQEDNGKERKAAVDSAGSKHANQNSFPSNAYPSKSKAQEMGASHSKESFHDKDADCNKEGNTEENRTDTVQIESDSDQDISDSNNSDTELFECPDPEFSNFEGERDEHKFDVNQFWACYDTSDGMPRFYAKVKKVCASPFELTITWLEAVPIDKTCKKWVDEELPVGCGSFKLGNDEKTSLRLSFSHQVHCEKGKKRGSLVIYPREGEVWALFHNWDKSWSLDPENHNEFKYEIVEILSGFVEGTGIKVCYLDKITGFVSLFQRASESKADSFWVGPSELYKLSHCVPCFKMTGAEREGVPMGSFELDPASLPMNHDDLYYPGKAKMADRDTLKSDKEKGKSMATEDTSTPKKFVVFEGIQGEMSKPRRSPRELNFIGKNAR